MNRFRFSIVLRFTIVLLLFAGCDKNCKIKYPKDLKPIDWENYNDVYDVIWNYTDIKESSDMGKTINTNSTQKAVKNFLFFYDVS